VARRYYGDAVAQLRRATALWPTSISAYGELARALYDVTLPADGAYVVPPTSVLRAAVTDDQSRYGRFVTICLMSTHAASAIAGAETSLSSVFIQRIAAWYAPLVDGLAVARSASATLNAAEIR
jgi:hypothetical protein